MKKTLIVLLTTLISTSLVLSEAANVSAKVENKDNITDNKDLEKGTKTPEKDEDEEENVEEVTNSSGTFKVKDDTIIKYTGDASEIEIPVKTSKREIMKIGDNVFKGNTSIKKVVVPERINSIGQSAFEECSNLEEVQIKGNKVGINSRCFLKCTSLKSINLDAVLYASSYSFYGDTSLEELNFCNGSSIQAYAFAYSGVKKASISSGEYSICVGSCAFLNCKSLEEVTLGNKTTGAEERAFYGCSNLEKVDTSNGQQDQYYARDAFEGTKWLENKLEESNMVVLNHCLIKYNAKEYYMPVSYYENDINKVDKVTGEEYKEELITKKKDLKEYETVDLSEDIHSLARGVFYGAYSVDKINFLYKNISVNYNTFDYTKWEKNILNTDNMIVISGQLYKVNNQVEEFVTPSNIDGFAAQAFPVKNNKIKKLTITKNINSLDSSVYIDKYESVILPEIMERRYGRDEKYKDIITFENVESDKVAFDFSRDGKYDYSKIKEADYDEKVESAEEDQNLENNKNEEDQKKQEEENKKKEEEQKKQEEENKNKEEEQKKQEEENKEKEEEQKKQEEENKEKEEEQKKQEENISLKIVEFTCDKGNTATDGDIVQFNVKAEGGQGKLLYQFKVDNKVVQEYSSVPTYSWKASGIANHEIEVSVKDEKGNTLDKKINCNVTEAKKPDSEEGKKKPDSSHEGDYNGIELTSLLMMFTVSSYFVSKKKKFNK